MYHKYFCPEKECTEEATKLHGWTKEKLKKYAKISAKDFKKIGSIIYRADKIVGHRI